MNLLVLLMRFSRRTLIFALIAGVLSGASSVLLLGLINAVLSQSSYSLTTLIALYAGLSVVFLGSNIVAQLLLVRIAQGAIFEMRMHLSRRILAAPLRDLEQLGAHRLLAALTDDVLDISNALLNIPLVCVYVAVVVVCILLLAWLSWKLLVAGLVFLLVGLVSYQMLVLRALGSLERAREQQDALFHHFRALTEGTKELKLHQQRRSSFLTRLLQPTASAFRRHNIAGMTIYASAIGWGEFLFFAFIALLLFVLPTWQSLPPRLLIGGTLIVLYMKTPLTVIMNLLPVFGRAKVALQKIESLGLSLLTQSEDGAQLDKPVAPPHWEGLVLGGITHAYHHEAEDRSFVLGPIDLSFVPGELVFLAGGNGSGKTTFAKVLTGLYAPEVGTIRLNGQVVTSENKETYRQLFSAVFSDFYLFEQLLGLEAPTLDERAHEYLARLQLQHKVRIDDGILSTIALSQGQRKRLALLNAYLEDRPFYVFDEWAADQDPLFKDLFYTAILPDLKTRGKTILAITHDEKYYYLADRLIKLDYGKIEADMEQINGYNQRRSRQYEDQVEYDT